MQNPTNHIEREDLEIGDDLTITKTSRRAAGAGAWIRERQRTKKRRESTYGVSR